MASPLLFCLLVCVFLDSVSAVRIPIDNCLPERFKDTDPKPLQWEPLYADAVFDPVGSNHRLQIILWGNVTGSKNAQPLPPPGSDHWSDPKQLDGKIVREPEPDNRDSRATTLISRVNFLSYRPFSAMTDFCADSLVNASCPLSPVFPSPDLTVPDDLPSVNISHEFFASYRFTTFAVTFIVIDGDSAKTNIGCASIPVTPDLGNLRWTLTIVPLVILLTVGFATAFAAVFCPWGTSDIFKWSSNHSREIPDLLRLVTPGFADCLQYIQFVVLTGALGLRYPGYYQPVVSNFAWSSLVFNHSFVGDGAPWQSVVDGIYVTDSRYGLGRLGQLVGLADAQHIWPSMMVWLIIITASVTVVFQLGFLVQALYRRFANIHEEDLRSKNIPFSLGNVVRIVFNFLFLPIVALSTFQLVIAGRAQQFVVALAAITLILIICSVMWFVRVLLTTRPQSDLLDQLPTLLLYGPLYNTYSDKATSFGVIPLVLTLLRGFAIGGAQGSGVAQIAILASAEVITLLTLLYIRPYDRQTSMNSFQAVFSSTRLISVLLLVAFVPSMGVTEGPKGWIGYAILTLHACVVLFAFFVNALQTITEVGVRMLGIGSHTTGGWTKIFGMRQLSRRMSRRRRATPGLSRQSFLSTAAMLDPDASKTGYVMPSGHIRSSSGASMGGGFMTRQQRSSSALDSIDTGIVRSFDTPTSFTPTTPGDTSMFTFLPSGTVSSSRTIDLADPYYRPPRRRRDTLSGSMISGSIRHSSATESRRYSQAGTIIADIPEGDSIRSQNATPAPYVHPSIHPPPRADYATREVDFYYGVRGPALNSERPVRKLGTGPADPTGPLAAAASWFQRLFSHKTKEKGKGFEVIRSTRMPPSMQQGGGPDAETGVAMSRLRRNGGSAFSDDDEDEEDDNDDASTSMLPRRDEDVPPRLPTPGRVPIESDSDIERPNEELNLPNIPRKSSKRNSYPSRSSSNLHVAEEPPTQSGASPPSDTLKSASSPPMLMPPMPFEGSDSQKNASSTRSSTEITATTDDLHSSRLDPEERPRSFGHVRQLNVQHVSHETNINLLSSSGEILESVSRQPSDADRPSQ